MDTTAATTDDRDDLVAVYLHHWSSLRTALKRHTGSRELAEDALQETWFRLDGLKNRQADIQDRQAFVLRIAANIAIDLLRRERRHSSRCISDEALLNALADNCPSPEVFAIDRDRIRLLARALVQLPPKPRQALLLNRCDGLTHAQIAKRLKVSESMVAKYLAQALRHCRDHFRALA